MNGQRVAPWKFDVLKASRFALEALLLEQTDVTKIWNGEWESGSEWTAVTRLRIQNGGQKKRKGKKRGNFTAVKVSFFRLCPQMTRTFLLVQS